MTFILVKSADIILYVQDVILETSYPSIFPVHNTYEKSNSRVNFVIKDDTLNDYFRSFPRRGKLPLEYQL